MLDSLIGLEPHQLSKNDQELVIIYSGLRKHGLIYKPFFSLRIDSLTTYGVYADPVQFEKIKNFDRNQLIRDNKKVRIELTGKLLVLGSFPVIDCSSIVKAEVDDGKTYWRK